MKHIRIVNNEIIECVDDTSFDTFNEEIKTFFIDAPDDFEMDVPLIPSNITLIPIISPVEFKLLFLPQERLAIKAERLNDEILEDLFSIIDDPRLKEINLNLESNKAVMEYLQSKGLITAERKAEIMTGVLK